MVTQLAREFGAYVIGTGRAADRQKALDFGAQEFVDLDNDALEDVVQFVLTASGERVACLTEEKIAPPWEALQLIFQALKDGLTAEASIGDVPVRQPTAETP
jgi:NADPH:quinone reductase-like Zn-dependent oxidoreductase